VLIRGGDFLATCFIVMPISMPEIYIKRYSDDIEHFKHVLDHLFIPALKLVNYEALPPTATGADLIHAEIIRNLEVCDLVLCDISTSNPNVFFELGIRTSLDRPVVLVRDNFTTHIPFDAGSINTYTYDARLQPWTLDDEIVRLANHITEAADKSDDRNSLWRYFGLTQRAAPAKVDNPTEAKLDLVIDEITRLSKKVSEDSPSTNSSDARPTSEIGEWKPRTEVIDRYFFSPGILISEILERRDSLTSDIPSVYEDFVGQVNEIVEASGISFNSIEYDEREHALVFDTGRHKLHAARANDILAAAKKASVKCLIKTKDTKLQTYTVDDEGKKHPL
jgi:hypothetical protein